jgi:hypothetical protein
MKKRLFRYAIGLVSIEEDELLIDARNKKEALKIAKKILKINASYMGMKIDNILRFNKHGDII